MIESKWSYAAVFLLLLSMGCTDYGRAVNTDSVPASFGGNPSDAELQGVYSDQISFSNLKYSQSGFQIDMFIVSNEKIWLIGKDGQREKLRKDFSAVSLFRFELAKRKSTNAITGCFRFISASGKNVAAEAIISGIYDVRLENGVLKLSEDQALYRGSATFLPRRTRLL